MRTEFASLFFLAVLALPAAASELPDGRYQVDAERNRVWSLTTEGVSVHDMSRPARAAVSLPYWAWVGALHACPPDLALGPKGEVVITSNVLPTVWRIDPDSFAVSVHPLELDTDKDKDVGFSGLVYSRQHGAYLATSQIQRSLWKIDPSLTKAQKLPLPAPITNTCDSK